MEMLIVGVISAFATVFVSRWVLRLPVDNSFAEAAHVQYSLQDLACLVAYVAGSVTLGRLPRQFDARWSDADGALLSIGISLFAIGSWWISISTLARARVIDWKSRCAYMLLSVPLAYCASLLAVFLAIMAMAWIVEGAVDKAALTVVFSIPAIIGLVSLRYLTSLVPPSSRPDGPDSEAISGLDRNSTG